MKRIQTLSQYLRQRSSEICADNKCESSAYITEDMVLIDICASDYFQGYSGRYAAILLPWAGNMKELRKAVKDGLPEPEPEPDFRVRGVGGSVFILTPLTKAAREWLEEHCPKDSEHQYFGGGLVVEARYIENLLTAIREDGLNV